MTVILCMLRSQDGFAPSEMFTLPFVCLAGLVLLSAAALWLEAFLERYQKILLPVFLILYGGIVFYFGIRSRGNPVNDSLAVINGAKYLAGLGDEISWTYFARWNNNIMPMVFLSLLFRVGNLLGFRDVYYFAVAVNTLQVVLALYLVFRICGRFSARRTAAAWIGMGMLSLYFPILGFTQSLYTDSLSFVWGIAAFFLWVGSREGDGGGWRFRIRDLSAGILWGIGAQIKLTTAISLIAVLLYLLIFEKGKTAWKQGVTLLVPVLAIFAASSLYIGTLPCNEYNDTWGVPRATTHLGIGLMGNGGWETESEFFTGVTAIYGMKEKEAFARDYILGHLGQFVNPEHVIAKLRYNFSNGTMNVSDFFWTADNHGFVYHCISYQGVYRATFAKWITAYWYLLLLLMMAACAGQGLLHGEKEISAYSFVPIMTMFGSMLFVMIFEANSRQMYNQLPWLVCAACMGLWWGLEKTGLPEKI